MSKTQQEKARFQIMYEDTIRPALIEKFGHTNPHSVAQLKKIVVNMGVGEASQNRAFMESAANDMALITGQKALICAARKSNATFKLREGMNVGCKVTLRGRRMYEFLDRLVTIAMPRIRDFRGLSAKSFDGRGNYAFGVTEHIIFPEIEYDKVDSTRGMDIVFHTSTNDDTEALELLKGLKLPISENKGE